MNRAKQNLITIDFSTRWFFTPPVVAIFIITLTGLFSSGVIIPIEPAIWWLVGLMFVLLTVLYGFFIKRFFLKGLFPVQLIAQGILLCPFSLRMGGTVLPWVGVLMAISGAVVLVAFYYRSRGGQTPPQTETTSVLAALPLPFAVTDANGCIISASDFLLRLVQKTSSAVNGEKINEVLPLDKETTSMGGKEWRILQAPMEDGAQYFQLEEARDVTVTLPASAGHGDGFIDSATSFYQQPYVIKRVEEELYRVYRYKRWMSAALLRVNFLENNPSPGFNPKNEDEVFNAYCRLVNSSTRETDILCLVGPRDVLLIMPETQLDDAQDVVGRLADLTAQLQEEIQGFSGAVEVLESTAFINASSGVLDFDLLMEKLDEQ